MLDAESQENTRMDGHRSQSNVGLPPLAPLRAEGRPEQAELWLPVKTPEGQAEIRQRQRGLSQRQRTMLLLVDGRRSMAQVKQVAVQAGATDTAFDELLDLGLIAVREPAVPARPVPVAPVSAPAVPAAVASAPAIAAPVPAASASPVYAAVEAPASEPPAVVPSGFTELDSAPMELQAEEEEESPRRKAANTRSGSTGIVDSMVSSLFPLLESAFGALGPGEDLGPRDDALEQARCMLLREVRAKAPVTGALTLMKLRRARNREELAALFEEVDSHISKPMRRLSAQQTLLHARGLLAGVTNDPWPHMS
jgi:hypothetical protein